MHVLGRKIFSLVGFFLACAVGGLKHGLGCCSSSLRPMVASSMSNTVEALSADVLHDAGYVFRFGDRLVDGFSQLLDEFSQLCVQGVSPFTPRHRTAWSALELFLTLLSDVPGEQPDSARLLNFSL